MNDDIRLLQNDGRTMQQYSGVSKAQLDLLALRYMARRLHIMLPQLSHLTHQSQPLLYRLRERYGHAHHIAIYNYQELFLERPLLFVGFIGRRQKHLCPAVVDAIQTVDGQLLEEVVGIPGLLSYSSLEMRNGDCYNLMLLRDADVNGPITGAETRAYAVYPLAYGSYNWIRLHKGIMPKGLDHTVMFLQETRQNALQRIQQRLSLREQLYTYC